MFDLILCQRDYDVISKVASQLVSVEKWESDEQLKKHISDEKKILLITDKCEIKPDILNLYNLDTNENLAFYHFCENVEQGEGFFPGVNDLVLCHDFYRDSGIYLVVNGDFGALPTFKKQTLFTVENYISFDQYKKGLFLDRDGVINIDHSYVHRVEDLDFREGVIDFLSDEDSHEFLKFIVTNQSGVARGKFSLEDVHLFHEAIKVEFNKVNVEFSDIQIAPYHFENGVGEFKWHSLTRKPYPGMILKITHKFPIDLKGSWMIGDKLSDHLELDLLNYVHIEGNYDLSQARGSVAKNFAQLKNIVFCS
jgi:D-glycero-D-manno-heptose 1,7-bisphosphate phosphatase